MVADLLHVWCRKANITNRYKHESMIIYLDPPSSHKNDVLSPYLFYTFPFFEGYLAGLGIGNMGNKNIYKWKITSII